MSQRPEKNGVIIYSDAHNDPTFWREGFVASLRLRRNFNSAK